MVIQTKSVCVLPDAPESECEGDAVIPSTEAWDSFFLNGEGVSDDFMAEPVPSSDPHIENTRTDGVISPSLGPGLRRGDEPKQT